MLEGGHWFDRREDTSLREKTTSVPITNQRGEGDFGALRQKIDTQPSASPATLETQLMLKYNRPVSKFLMKKTDAEKKNIWKIARGSYPERKEEERKEKEEFFDGLTSHRSLIKYSRSSEGNLKTEIYTLSLN